MVSKRLNRYAATALLLALLSPLIILAVRSEGYHATKIDLNDAGIWTVSKARGSIGRVNTQIGLIEVALPAQDPQNDFDVSQIDDTVVLQLPGAKQVVPIDVALAKHLDPITLPDKAQFMMGGAMAAALDPANGKVWVAPRSALSSLVTEGQPAVLEAGARSVMTVGADGTVFAYAAGSTELQTLPAGSPPVGRVALAEAAAEPTITAVGSYPVVLDVASSKLLIPGRPTVDLAPFGANPVLQLAGPANADVLVATDTALLAVPLSGGAVRTLTKAGTRNPVAPVWLDGCARGAWRGTPTFAQVCDGADAQVSPIDDMPAQDALAFRVNRGRVILNDLVNGNNLLFTPDQPQKVNNWQDALQRDNKQGDTNQNTVDRDRSFDCSAGEKAPEAVDDRAGTRKGRPVIVRVLANDVIPDCVVPQVTLVDASLPPPEVGVVTVVNGGREIQVAPAMGNADKSMTFSYEATGSTGRSEAKVTVDIVADAVNNPPVPAEDTTTVEAGKSIRVNVLDNDTDPDGDALTLTTVTTTDGTVTFRAQGDVTYTASGAAAGKKQVAYTITDGQGGEPVPGVLTVTVISADDVQAPIARADQLNAFVGRDSAINVLANDDDAHGRPLSLAHIDEPPGLGVVWTERGEVKVHPTATGSTTLTYQVTDGDKTSSGRLRVDVLESGANHPPVAVRDDLAARSGVPALMDLVANDIDLDGDVLAVTSAVAPPESGLSVELIDLHLVRVTAPAGFNRTVEVPYQVTDGQASAFGVLVVRPVLAAGVDQGPTAAPDDVSVRAGNATIAKVLGNDSDPEGDRLKITAAGGRTDLGAEVVGQTPLPADQGSLFIEGEELRYVAPANGPLTIKTSYTVRDVAGNVADGLLTIHVAPADPSQNRPPEPPLLEARVFAGSEVTIKVPLIGMDPDGDPVALIGIGDQPPVKGEVSVTDDGFSYHADRGPGGTDSFSFIVRDSIGLEATGRVRVAVLPKPESNSDPVAVPDRGVVQVGKSTPIAVLANDSDPDGDPVSLLTTGKDAPTKPNAGTVAVDADGKRLIFTAPATISKEQAQQSFSYTAADGRGGSAQGVVTVEITNDPPPNELPVARDDLVKAQKPGSTVDVDVLANDHDPDGDLGQATIAVLDQPRATVVGGKVRVQAGDTSVAFAYELTDQQGGKARAIVSVPVTKLPPVCDVQTGKVKAGTSISIDVLRSCKDPAGGALKVQSVGNARGGTVVLDGSGASFTAADHVDGDGGFTFVVATSDNKSTAVGAVRLEVTGQDFAPTFDSGTVTLPAGGERTIDLVSRTHDLNVEDKHTFEGLSGATDRIKATIEGTNLKITTSDDAKGQTTTLAFKVSDNSHTIDGRIEVQVLKHDGAPPRAVDDAKETLQEKAVTLDLTANDSDPLGKGLTLQDDIEAQGGTVVITDHKGIVEFTPAAAFHGTATFTYKILDETRDPDRESSATAKVTVLGRPDPVQPPTRTKQESGKISLQWAAPSSNGAPIDFYLVFNADGSPPTRCPSTTCEITNLTNGTKYKFRVAAHNAAVTTDSEYDTTSLYSPEYTPDELPPIPDVPTLKFGDRQIDVSWADDQLKNKGTPIIHYLLKISGGPNAAASETRELPPSPTSYTWTGLTNGASYKFSLAAQNSAESGSGKTDFSGLTNDPVNSIPAAAPGVVPNIVATRSDKDTTAGGWVTVTWAKPLDNGDPNLTYEITVNPPDVPPIVIKNAVPQPTPIGGLTNGTKYTFSIAATNKAGTGPAGSSNVAVPAALPDKVGLVQAAPDDQHARLTFDTPPMNGGAISYWNIRANGGAAARYNASSPREGTSQTVAVGVPQLNLANGQAYTFAVQACNDNTANGVVGCGDWSNPSGSVKPYGAPGQPGAGGSVAGTSVTFNWSAPGNDGGSDLVRFDARVLRSDGTLVAERHDMGTSLRIDEGRYATRYILHVTATNAGNPDTNGVRQPERTGPEATDGETTVNPPPPDPKIVLSKGADVSTSQCSTSSCAKFHVVMTNFAPNALVDLECWAGPNGGGSGKFWPAAGSTQRRRVDSGGSWSGDLDCYYGWPNTTVWVQAGSTRSNDYTWPP